MSDKLVTSQPAPPLVGQDLNFWRVFLLGLSSTIGVGAFVGLGIGTSIAGLQIVQALVLAAIVTLCTGWSQIDLSTTKPITATATGDEHPGLVGRDIYGYSDTLLNSWLGFAAAWGLSLSQAAAAATVALGLAGYLLGGLGWQDPIGILPVALLAVLVTVGVIRQGVRLTGNWKLLRILITLATLGFLIAGGLPQTQQLDLQRFGMLLAPASAQLPGLGNVLGQTLQAASLMIVAFAGYERVIQPSSKGRSRSVLIKVLLLLTALTLFLYIGVSIITLASVSSDDLLDAVEAFVAPLQIVARQFAMPGSGVIVSIGAWITLVGVLHYLSNTLARSLWIMGLRRDLPETLAGLHSAKAVPTAAMTIAGAAIASLVLVADVTKLWAFSAFAFLIYAAITNLAAFRLNRSHSSRWIAGLGGLFCLFLIFWLEWQTWIMGLGLIVIGLIWRGINLWVTEQADHQD